MEENCLSSGSFVRKFMDDDGFIKCEIFAKIFVFVFILSFIIFNLTMALFPLSPEYFFSYNSFVVSLPIFVTHPALVFALISFFNAKAAKKEGFAVNKCVLPFCIVNFVAEGLYWLSVTAALIICSY